MAGEILAHSFTQQVLIVNNRTIENFGEGDDVINIEYRNDRVSDTVGADGKMQPSISADNSAEITVKLLAGAPENDFFELLYHQYINQEITGISVSLYNAVTGRGEVATTAYIPKLANTTKGTKAQDREWRFIAPNVAIQQAVR